MTERGPSSLIQLAARLLEEGPAHTLAVAEEVLGLTGHPGAAAKAVFALLGADPRFQVDGEGVWRLEEGLSTVGPSLTAHDYAVVDVETTGGSYERGHRIMEVAVVEVRDGQVGPVFRTLVNPGRSVPRVVTRITGLTREIVEPAPYFEEIAEELMDRLEGRVFVAHNVRFDWGMVSRHLADTLGRIPRVPRLCTVKLARRLLPDLRRRNLDAVADYYRVPIHDRHRAYGDALATARILLRLLDEAGSRGIGDLQALQAFMGGSRRDPWQRDAFEADVPGPS